MERRVLVYAPAGQDGRLATRVLGAAGLAAVVCANEEELAARLREGAGALMVVEEALAAAALRSTLTRFLAQQPAWSDLPILVLTKQGADSLEAQRAVEHLGNVTLLERPVRTTTLVTAARSALRARERQYQLRAFNVRKDEFLATLAHELRNPLAPIRNAVAIVERLHPTEQVGSLVGMVERQVTHLTRLVDDLLDVARITSGKLELRPTLTTALRVANHALEIAQADLSSKGHRVTVDLPPHEVVLKADHVRVVQSVANLLVNAAKFTPPAGDIRLSVRVDAPVIEFVVRDSGKGLDPGEFERIFDMFEQSHAVGEPSGGLGLGLHLTKVFAQLHGGSVRARSEGLGRGSEFVLRLPVIDSAGAGREPGGAGAAGVIPRSILVVDDNVDAADTLQALLSLHGAAVSVAYDGAAAVECVLRDAPEAVVMDVGMPVMNGYEAARRIRRERPAGGPVLVALTGWGQYADKARAAEAGFDHHLVKPLDFQALLACLSATEPAA